MLTQTCMPTADSLQCRKSCRRLPLTFLDPEGAVLVSGIASQCCLQVNGLVTDTFARRHRMAVLTSGKVESHAE